MINKPYIKLIHKDSSISTVDDIVSNGFGKLLLGISPSELLQFKDENGFTNKQRVFQEYFENELENNKSLPDNRLLVKVDTTFIIPKDRLNIDNSYAITLSSENTSDFRGYLSPELLKLYTNERFSTKFKTDSGVSRTIFNNASVFIYLRSQDRLIDVTPFIIQLTTDSSDDGCSFSFQLTAISAILKNNQLEPDIDNFYRFTHNSGFTRTINKAKVFGRLFFHEVVIPNDLVFIRFEELGFEERGKTNPKFELSTSKIQNKAYDVIGMVDSNQISFNPESADISINISGRDLTKTIIDDGSYFYIEEFAGKLFLDKPENEKFRRRIFGRIENFTTLGFRSIEDSINLVVNQYSATGHIPSKIFNSYGDRRNRLLVEQDGRLVEKFKDGIWQIIDVEVSPEIRNLRLADSSISEASGSLINTIKSFCQDPFVQFYTETIGDRFKFIARRPPFNESGYNELAKYAIDIEPEDTLSVSLNFSDSEIYTYYLLTPRAYLGGGNTDFIRSEIPGIVFPKLVDIFGARPYDKVSNYLTFAPKENELKISYDRKQVIQDLRFMIQSTVYLPFTRSGTIVINGDRRIKKNTIIRLKLTGELCYVNSVSNAYEHGNTINRTTTLQVSRCMVERFTKPQDIQGFKNKVSYFNIVSTPIDEQLFRDDTKQTSDLLQNWKESRNMANEPEILNFFLQRRQFEK